jgi:Spy/CpxP family protein refolding chaperone
MRTYGSKLGLILLFAGAVVLAQQPPAPQQPPQPPQGVGPGAGGGMGMGMGRGLGMGRGPNAAPAPQPGRGPMPRGMGRWWKDPQMVEKLGVTADQQKKMDDIFQQHRLKLIALTASVETEEVTLEPMMAADQPDEARIVAQIDKVAQARAELEKANARMLLGIRRILTPDQWKKLQAEAPRPGRGPGGQRPPAPRKAQ